jgi:hypothetical protein
VIIVNVRILIPTLFLLALTPTGPVAAQTYYKWTDDNGTVHFTAQPPVDREYERVTASMGRLGNADVASELDSEPAESADDVQMPRRAPPDPEVVEARCQQARENLFWLESKQRIRVEEDDGTQRYVDNDERERLLEDARTAVDDWCDEGG